MEITDDLRERAHKLLSPHELEKAMLFPFANTPIELLMGCALIAEVHRRNPVMILPGEMFGLSAARKSQQIGDIEWQVLAQVPVGKYCADFVLRHRGAGTRIWLVAIECDGHDFHDRTKEQATRDRERDRQFQKQGLLIARFTGRDIWANPTRCAAEAFALALAADDRHNAWETTGAN